MECFYHENRAAVGLCPGCHKAACRECLTDRGGELLCSACFEQRAVDFIAESARKVARAKKALIWSIVWTVCAGSAVCTVLFTQFNLNLNLGLDILVAFICVYVLWAIYWVTGPIERFRSNLRYGGRTTTRTTIFVGDNAFAAGGCLGTLIGYCFILLVYASIPIVFGALGGGIYFFIKTLYTAGYLGKTTK